jgi:hypothetical protein
MNAFRYDTSGRWYKGNTHVHSIASDGGKGFKELAEMYRSVGYDFLFRTDHWVLSEAGRDAEKYPLLWLDGVELDGKDHTGAYFHAVCLGRVTGIRREDGFEAGLTSARQQGALTILAHPHWCGNSLEDGIRWQFDGIEVYNHVCRWLNGKSCGLVHWDAALKHNPSTLGFAVDDAHVRPEHPGWNGGWVMVNAPECTAAAITAAIRCGNFYSSCGPELRSIKFDGDEVQVATSPVRFVRLVGPDCNGNRVGSFDGQLITAASFSVPKEWRYAYVELEDQEGRRAWTNSLHVTDRSPWTT